MSQKGRIVFSARKRLIAAAISACFSTTPAWANPTGPQVVNGAASFNQSGSLLTVNNSNGAIINWNSFSIGASETTRFNQASASSSVLNRVIANDPSVLLGTLSSNGKVWLVNPAGILVGQGAKIDVAGFVASTLNVANQDFLAGRLNFGATPNAGSVQNDGQITTPSGGSVYLVAPSVSNNGIIDAPNGEVILAAGQTVQLLDTGTPGVSVAITGAQGNVTNLGRIVSEAGQIGIAGVLVKNSGTLNASSVVKEGGRIFLKATKSIGLADTSTISADGTIGGHVVAKTEDNGQLSGELIAHGAILARGNGASGSGGYVETSAKTADINSVRVNTGGGTWLLDPDDVEINSSGSIPGATLVTPTTISNALVNSDFVVQTNPAGTGGNGDIFVNSAVSWNSGNTLTLNALRNINVNQSISNSGIGGLNLYAGGSITDASMISTYGSVNFLAQGAIIFGNTINSGSVSSYGSPITLVANWDGSTATPDVAATGQCSGTFCSISGTGSISTDGGYMMYPGTNVDAGALTLKAPADMDLSNISISAVGGTGGAASIGGAGGAVSITSTQGNLTVGSINAPGGMGAYGSPGTSVAPNGGDGGTGGAGGTVNLSAAGALTLVAGTSACGMPPCPPAGGGINVSGGMGGGGGTGYGTYDPVTFAMTYTGAGGNGGTGGNAGTIAMNANSITLDGASISAQAGSGGWGGPGTTTGTTGAAGVGSAVTLATIGDINLTGNNAVSGAQLDLLAGNNIVFGTTTGGVTTGGTLSTNGTPTALIANWNGSTVTPDVAGTGRCVGAFCSISGTGSISTDGGYMMYPGTNVNVDAGALTLKSGGDMDLSNLSISANGGFGSYPAGMGGAGGAVSITSTQGSLTIGNVSAAGGGGSSGVFGTSTAVNGGDGGMGGAGGSVTLSAAGALTLVAGTSSCGMPPCPPAGGGINVSGGWGGWGGSGYTSTIQPLPPLPPVPVVYSGTGGSGGVGGSAGTVNISAGSIALGAAPINAQGGGGGGGGQGISVGSAAAGGAGGAITITSTTGDLTVSSINAAGGMGAYGGSGTDALPNGGDGGTGGAGGTVNLSAAGALTLVAGTSACGMPPCPPVNSGINVFGGWGGGGGPGYSTFDTATSTTTYSGSGGNGGTGGNAGSINMNASSITLDGASISAQAGSGGWGGIGTSTGSMGGSGIVGNLALNAAGDVDILSSNVWSDGVLTVTGANLNVTAATGPALLQGANVTATMTGNISVTGSALGQAAIAAIAGPQTISAGGDLLLTGGEGNYNAATISQSGTGAQTVTVTGSIIGTAGGNTLNGSGNNAYILHNGSGLQTVSADSVQLTGGGGTSGNRNQAAILTLPGSGASQEVDIGSGGLSVHAGNGSGSGNTAGIWVLDDFGTNYNTSATQVVNVAGNVAMTGGDNGANAALNNNASIFQSATGVGAAQTVSVDGTITLMGAASGTGGAYITSVAPNQAVSAGGIVLQGNGGTDGTNDAAGIVQNNVSGAQSVTVNGGGSITATGGSGSGGTNHGEIYSVGSGVQSIIFTSGGAISLTGGMGAAGPGASAGNEALIMTTVGSQSITGAPSIALQGGTDGSLPSGSTNLGNNALIRAGLSQSIDAGAIALTGGDSGIDSSATIQAPTQTIDASSVSLSGGGASGTFSGARIGGLGGVAAAGPTNLTLTTTGAVNLTGGANSAVAIGTNPLGGQTTDITINSGGDVTLTPGSGVGALIGSSVGNVAGGDISITSGGNITLGNNSSVGTAIRTTGNVTLNASPAGGAISEDAASVIEAGSLTTSSDTGTVLNGANLITSSFGATNSTSGNIGLINTSNPYTLTITGITNTGGDIDVDNTGAVTTTGAVSASGVVNIVTHSPLTIGAGGVTAGGGINLTAGQTSGTGDILTLDGPISSTGSGSSITLTAGDDLVQNANVTANGGTVSADSQTGSISMASGTTTSSGGGTISYSAPSGDVTVSSLNASSGSVDLSAGGSIQPAAGSTGANVVGGSATITAGTDVTLSTQVTQLSVTAPTSSVTNTPPVTSPPDDDHDGHHHEKHHDHDRWHDSHHHGDHDVKHGKEEGKDKHDEGKLAVNKRASHD